MLKRARRVFLGCPGVWALAVVALAPAAAQAQQGGLFPLRTINRERTPCEMEDPVYRMYRHDFYGYHPTCWRKFPTGWGCPSTEAPDAKKAFDERKPDANKPMNDTGDGEAMPGADGDPKAGARPAPDAVPALPRGRSPFEMNDTPPVTPSPSGRGVADPSGLPSVADPNAPAAPRPDGPGGAPPEDRNQGPNLELPDPTVPPAPAPTAGMPSPVSEPNASGFQPARRRGLFSQLFNGQMFRR